MKLSSVFKKKLVLEVNVLDTEVKDGLNFHKNIPFTGRLLEYNEEGNIEASVMCNKGHVTGPYKQFYKSGKLEIKKVFVHDEINNETCYYENGKTKYIILYEDGFKKLQQDYYESGKIRKIKSYAFVERYNDSVPHGVEISYDENGKKISESIWEYGLPNGHINY